MQFSRRAASSQASKLPSRESSRQCRSFLRFYTITRPPYPPPSIRSSLRGAVAPRARAPTFPVSIPRQVPATSEFASLRARDIVEPETKDCDIIAVRVRGMTLSASSVKSPRLLNFFSGYHEAVAREQTSASRRAIRETFKSPLTLISVIEPCFPSGPFRRRGIPIIP